MWLPFLAAGGPVRYLENLGEYQNDIFSVMSLRAWNFWWIVQQYAGGDEFVSDRVSIIGPISFRVLGFVVTGLLSLYVALKIWRDPQPRTLVLGLAATTLAAFTFLTTMHERYAYGALVFLMLLIPEARVRWLGLAFGVVFTLNLVAAIPATEELGRLLPVWGPLGLVGSVVMVVLTGLTLYELQRPAVAVAGPGPALAGARSGHDMTALAGVARWVEPTEVDPRRPLRLGLSLFGLILLVGTFVPPHGFDLLAYWSLDLSNPYAGVRRRPGSLPVCTADCARSWRRSARCRGRS